MESYNQKILTALTQCLLDNQDWRFGQALHNLGINEWANPINPASENYRLRDIHGDTNEKIYERVKINELKIQQAKK